MTQDQPVAAPLIGWPAPAVRLRPGSRRPSNLPVELSQPPGVGSIQYYLPEEREPSVVCHPPATFAGRGVVAFGRGGGERGVKDRCRAVAGSGLPRSPRLKLLGTSGSLECLGRQEERMRPMSSYLDYSGPGRRAERGRADDPGQHPGGHAHRVWTKRVGNNPTLRVLLLHGGPGAPTSTWRPATATCPPPGRVLLLRPARLRVQRPARRAVAVGARPVRRRGGAGPPGARAGPGQLRPLRPVLGRHPGHRVRAGPPAAPARARHLQHDGERPGLQRLRRAGTDAGDGPGGAGRDQGARGERATSRTRGTWSC